MIAEKEMPEFDEHDSMLPDFDDTDLISEPEGQNVENVEEIDPTKLDPETKEKLDISEPETEDV